MIKFTRLAHGKEGRLESQIVLPVRKIAHESGLGKDKVEAKEKSKIGSKSRKDGAAFERKVRKDLKDKCYLVIKNPNNVFWDENNVNKPPEERTGVFDQGKPKFNPFTKSMMMMSGGFPDFIAFKPGDWNNIGVEAKLNGYLDPEERAKCDFLLHEHIFSKILIASKDKNKRGKIIYKEYEKK